MRARSEVDVLICGGGTAGAIAAIAAARTGAHTLLVEQHGRIGGMASTGMSFLGMSDASGSRALGGIGAELFERLIAAGAAFPDRPDRQVGSVSVADPLMLQHMLITMLIEADVRFLLHAFCVDAAVEGSRIRGVLAAHKGGLEVLTARAVVDATGDGVRRGSTRNCRIAGVSKSHQNRDFWDGGGARRTMTVASVPQGCPKE